MKIVFLDAETLHRGELDWSSLERAGEFVAYDFTAPSDALARAQGAGVLITNKVPITEEMIDQLPSLRLIQVSATGFNTIDAPAARARSIDVANVPAYSTMSVAQTTIGLLIELATGVGHFVGRVREGAWQGSASYSYWDRPLVELAGKRLGIIGYGSIGHAVGAVAQALGMEVAAEDRGRPVDVLTLSRRDLLATSDAVSLHCPQNAQTAGMVDGEFLATMKPGAWLLNVSRGGLVDEIAILRALNSGQLGAYAADVLSQEPPSSGNPLIGAPNVLLTPHIAWASVASRQRLVDAMARNIRTYVAGTPQNIVN